MMERNNIALIRLTVFLLAVPLVDISALARENVATGYFTDGYVHKHKLNPALTPNMSYASMPLLNFGASAQSSLAMKDIFYPQDGKLNSVFSPTPSDVTEGLLAGIARKNTLIAGIEEQIMSVGSFNGRGNIFTAVSLDIRAGLDAVLPKGLFEFAKGAGQDGLYDMSGLSGTALAFSQLSISQSYSIKKKIHLGYRLKFLFGMEDTDIRYDTFNAELTAERWFVDAKGEIYSAPVHFGKKNAPEGYEILDFAKMDYGIMADNLTYFFGNFGFAADLGLSWDVSDVLQVSASVTDIGFLNFKDGQYAVSDHSGKRHSIVYPQVAGEPNQEGMKDLFNQLATLSEFRENSTSAAVSCKLPLTVRAGAQYRIPTYKKFSFGALYTQRFHPVESWWEVRGSANYDALPWLGISASYAYGTFKSQLGFLLDIHVRGFNFFIGSDAIPLRYNPQGIPVSAYAAQLSFGINFLFGKYFGRYML